jgi:hypothetical protein
VVDARLEVAAVLQHVREQAQLETGSLELHAQPRADSGLAVGEAHDVVPVRLEPAGHRAQHRGPAGTAEILEPSG